MSPRARRGKGPLLVRRTQFPFAADGYEVDLLYAEGKLYQELENHLGVTLDVYRKHGTVS